MVPIVALTLLSAGFVLALGLEWLVWRGSLRLGVLAHPTGRSSHLVATPTAGGIAIVVPVVGYLIWLGLLGSQPAAALAAGGLALAAIGLWDDLREVSPLLRLLMHALAAAALVAVSMPQSAWIVLAVAGFALVWQINLYNFMDGIDGLAGAQGLVFLVGAQIVGQGVPGWPGDVMWLSAGALLAFLVFNWPPARIFMGDVGSGFLGLLTGALALLLWQQQTLPLAVSLILLCGFWFDATYTLMIRLVTGQAFTQAHRSHLYQKVAAQRGHLWTTSAFLVYAAVWLLPLAWLCAAASPEMPQALWWIALAAAPLAAAAWWFGAGLPAGGAHQSHD
ncbi:MAG: glycosyl transferase [Pseudomonadales bacterium]